jgi:hypothetical protein
VDGNGGEEPAVEIGADGTPEAAVTTPHVSPSASLNPNPQALNMTTPEEAPGVLPFTSTDYLAVDPYRPHSEAGFIAEPGSRPEATD